MKYHGAVDDVFSVEFESLADFRTRSIPARRRCRRSRCSGVRCRARVCATSTASTPRWRRSPASTRIRRACAIRSQSSTAAAGHLRSAHVLVLPAGRHRQARARVLRLDGRIDRAANGLLRTAPAFQLTSRWHGVLGPGQTRPRDRSARRSHVQCERRLSTEPDEVRPVLDGLISERPPRRRLARARTRNIVKGLCVLSSAAVTVH